MTEKSCNNCRHLIYRKKEGVFYRYYCLLEGRFVEHIETPIMTSCCEKWDGETKMKASEELHHWKKEAESRHKMGMIVPSWLYEKIHMLEREVKQEKKNDSKHD